MAFSWTEAWVIIKPLALHIIGMFVYALIIFKFYRFIAKKNIFTLNLTKYNQTKHSFFKKVKHLLLYFLENVMVMPVIIFFAFGVLSTLIAFMAENILPEQILITSMAIVGAVRIAAYYNEDLSRDLAKMLPFALLGIFIINSSIITFSNPAILLGWSLENISTLLYYLIFVAGLEFILSIAYEINLKVGKRTVPRQVKSEELK